MNHEIKYITYKDAILIALTILATIGIAVFFFLWQNAEDKEREIRNTANHLFLHESVGFEIDEEGNIVSVKE
ncbi:MAG: hypothetical protein F4X82_01600 [Candidatus Spechtbacteria bacterium SB0662_bin_43]|uniref:Uncharacterized protein n=1 Tax=Candidatus Spechtbacteria bacterium SB0662_bin_43 TaxID=2604897 RepID=A0A845DJ23_9BACT|nr:hypothetical protein [Candidatus Spechtbacteria bacterium SB0662_bin_43]